MLRNSFVAYSPADKTKSVNPSNNSAQHPNPYAEILLSFIAFFFMVLAVSLFFNSRRLYAPMFAMMALYLVKMGSLYVSCEKTNIGKVQHIMKPFAFGDIFDRRVLGY